LLAQQLGDRLAHGPATPASSVAMSSAAPALRSRRSRCTVSRWALTARRGAAGQAPTQCRHRGDDGCVAHLASLHLDEQHGRAMNSDSPSR